ncbi:MAG: TonB-dependent receptor [Casimicrobiaceae bacterium]
MKVIKKPHPRMLIAAAVAGLFAAPAAVVQAADIKVDVTGSNIKRVEGEGSLPVQVITREEIDRTGVTSVAELLNYVSANNSAGAVSVNNVIGGQVNSIQTASLRGLGGQNTLVLMNGKRLTQSSGEIQGAYGVNLDVIPFAAVERVEILKDGASAVYGSDAVGGVINFIMRQDYRGIDAQVYYGAPSSGGGGEAFNAQITGGIGDLSKDKYNIFGSYFYQKQKSFDQNRRSWSNHSIDLDQGLFALSGQTFPAYISTRGANGVPLGNLTYPNCAPSIAIPAGLVSGESRCWYDPAAIDGVNAIPEQTTNSFYVAGRWQFNPNWQLYANGSWARVETDFTIQPTPLSDQITYGPSGEFLSTILVQPTSPYYPTAAAAAAGIAGTPLNVRYRANALGLRENVDVNDQWQAVAGVKGSAWNWDMDFNFAYSRGTTKETPKNGFFRDSQILPLLNTDGFNPFGAQTPAFQSQIDALQWREKALDATSSGYTMEAKGSTDIYQLPAGALALAVGGQYGHQQLKQTFNAALQIGDVTGYGGNNLDIDASRNVWALFAEFNIPILKTLEATAAVRFDDYSDFGNTTNPKFSIRWNPVSTLLFRGSWGTSFVAPTLTQAYGANTTGLSELFGPNADPVRCPVTGEQFDCQNQYNVRFGGNPNLQPQKATQWQIGALIEPVSAFNFGVDYFNINLSNLISNGVTPGTILDNQTQYGSLITRGPPDAQFPNLPGPIANIDQRFINLGEVRIEGLDFTAQVKLPPTAFGRFTGNLNGTYYIKYDTQQPDGTFLGGVSNVFGAATSGVSPRYKQYATITWDYGPWTTTLGNQYISSYVDAQTDGNDDLRRVGTQSIWDLYGAYSGLKKWKFALGARNLFNTPPPFTNQHYDFQAGYDVSNYDVRGRFIYGTIRYAFN